MAVVSITASGFYDGRDFAIDLSPRFSPIEEIRLQAAVLEDVPSIDVGSPTLNAELREIEIRTAIEDTARLHWDLG